MMRVNVEMQDLNIASNTSATQARWPSRGRSKSTRQYTS